MKKILALTVAALFALSISGTVLAHGNQGGCGNDHSFNTQTHDRGCPKPPPTDPCEDLRTSSKDHDSTECSTSSTSETTEVTTTVDTTTIDTTSETTTSETTTSETTTSETTTSETTTADTTTSETTTADTTTSETTASPGPTATPVITPPPTDAIDGDGNGNSSPSGFPFILLGVIGLAAVALLLFRKPIKR